MRVVHDVLKCVTTPLSRTSPDVSQRNVEKKRRKVRERWSGCWSEEDRGVRSEESGGSSEW